MLFLSGFELYPRWVPLIINVLSHKTLISFQLLLPRKMIILQFMHTLTYTFFQQYVFLYIPLQEPTM